MERVSFAEARERLPSPRMIHVSTGIDLETLHVPGPSPTLVFLHGGLGNLWNFYPQLAYFDSKHHVIAYSYAGNGGSEARADLSLESDVQDLRALIQKLAIAAPIIVGWSYGTEVAIEYAKRYPTSGLCLAAGGAFGITPKWELPLLQLMVATRAYRVLPRMGPLKMLARRTMFHAETEDAVINDVMQSNPLPRRESAWRTITEGFWGYDGRPGIDAIRVPALVLHGPADRVVPKSVAQETAKLLPEGRFEEILRSGHVLLAERPATVNAWLEWFIERATA